MYPATAQMVIKLKIDYPMKLSTIKVNYLPIAAARHLYKQKKCKTLSMIIYSANLPLQEDLARLIKHVSPESHDPGLEFGAADSIQESVKVGFLEKLGHYT